MVAMFQAPDTALEALVETLGVRGYAVLAPHDAAALCGVTLDALGALAPAWNALPPDAYLRDGGRYRRRRHGCFVVGPDRVEQMPHRAHYQPLDYNALHGGLQRWFEPILPEIAATPTWSNALSAIGTCLRRVRSADRWFVEAHQFRIDTTDGIGRPTPEGAHRDGVDFVAVFIVDRHAIRGGETRVFDANGPDGQRFTLTAPWTLLLLDDTRVVHETTPIQPQVGTIVGYRDTLVLTYRSGGFQAEA